MRDILEDAKSLQETIVEDRRVLHQIPEVGMYLPESVAYLEKRLTEMDIPYRRCGVLPEEIRQKYVAMGFPYMEGATGLVATIVSGSPCFLLRADFDALPMGEINDLPFCSQRPNAAHMCGHDTHAAMLLGAAKLLKDRESQLKGTVKLMFQPGEEMGYGSKTMVDDGLLENPRVDAAMGIHIFSTVESGTLQYFTGIASSSLDTFSFQIQGRGGHSSTPEQTVDPMMIASQIYTAANLMMTREVSPMVTATLSGILHSGTAANIIPDTAQLQFGLRTYNKEARAHVLQRLPELAEGYAKAWRGSVELSAFNCPCTYCDAGVTQALLPTVRRVMGAQRVSESPPMSGTEDFSYVAEAVPSTFLLLGAGAPGNYPHHNTRMTLDESVFHLGAALHASCAMDWLAAHSE